MFGKREVHRDAGTGQFVSDRAVELDPDGTVTEQVVVSDPHPYIGEVVHYVSYGTPGGEYKSECRAAVVTEVFSADEVSLAVLNPTGFFFNTNLTHDNSEEPAGGTWHRLTHG